MAAVLPPRPGRDQAAAAVWRGKPSPSAPSGWWHPDPGRTCPCKHRGGHAKYGPAVACELASQTEAWRLEVARVWPCARQAGPLILDDPAIPTRYCVCGCDHCPGRGSHCLKHAAGCHLLGGCTFTLGTDGCREITLAERMAAHRQASAPVTSTDTPGLVGWGDTTRQGGHAMPSSRAKAAGIARDQAKREGRPDLKAVPDLPADEPKPLTKGDLARKAARDALEPWQQAVYDQIMDGGGRHVTALAQARKVTAPDPADDTSDPEPGDPVTVTDITDAELAHNVPADPFDVDEMFAAFNAMAGAGGAESLPDAVPVIAAQHKAEQDAEPKPPVPKPVPVPQAKQPPAPKPPAPKPPRPAPKPSEGATCTVAAVPFDRHLGTVTTADSKVHDCEHAARNGHIEKSAALGCAKRLLRNYPAGQVGTRVKSRYNGAYTPNGGEQVLCGCRFGHREEHSAIECAKQKAAAAGLRA